MNGREMLEKMDLIDLELVEKATYGEGKQKRMRKFGVVLGCAAALAAAVMILVSLETGPVSTPTEALTPTAASTPTEAVKPTEASTPTEAVKPTETVNSETDTQTEGTRYIYYEGYLYKDSGESVEAWGYEKVLGEIVKNRTSGKPRKNLHAKGIPEGTEVLSRSTTDGAPTKLFIKNAEGRLDVFVSAGSEIPQPTGYPSGTVQQACVFVKGKLYRNAAVLTGELEDFEYLGEIQKIDNENYPDEELEGARLFTGQKVYYLPGKDEVYVGEGSQYRKFK